MRPNILELDEKIVDWRQKFIASRRPRSGVLHIKLGLRYNSIIDLVMVASGEIGVKVVMELCQRVLDGRKMPDEWKTSAIGPIFKGKGDVMGCGLYRRVKLLGHVMKIVGGTREANTNTNQFE